MRILSDTDKKFIDRICEGHTHISVLLTDHIPSLILGINRDEGKAELILPKTSEQSQLTENATIQTEKIIYIIKFLLYLEKEGYALSGYFAHGRTVQGQMGLPKTIAKYDKNPSDYVHWRFTDKRMEEFVFKYSDLTIFATHQLIAFKNNSYRTKEDSRFRTSVTISTIAILTSLSLGLTSIYISKTKDGPTKQQTEDVKSVLEEIKNQSNQYPTKQQLDNLIKRLDTLIKSNTTQTKK